MATFTISKKDYIGPSSQSFRPIKKTAFERFNPNVLGLGNIEQNSQRVPSIAAVFDLQGFTTFCNQSDPELSIPKYLSAFLDWIFISIRKETTKEIKDESIFVWHELPFLAKFLGDGILFLWKADSMNAVRQHNLIISLFQICSSYEANFYSLMKRRVTDAPQKLRCGVAKGTVYSVGNASKIAWLNVRL
jgi:hypothetical protein